MKGLQYMKVNETSETIYQTIAKSIVVTPYWDTGDRLKSFGDVTTYSDKLVEIVEHCYDLKMGDKIISKGMCDLNLYIDNELYPGDVDEYWESNDTLFIDVIVGGG